MLQAFQVSDQRLQFVHFGRGRRPGDGLLRRTVVRDQLGVHFVCLVAEQFALGLVVDARRIHDANRVPGLMEVPGPCFPIAASSFQTGMQLLYTMFAQLFVQLSEAPGLVAERAIILFVFL